MGSRALWLDVACFMVICLGALPPLPKLLMLMDRLLPVKSPKSPHHSSWRSSHSTMTNIPWRNRDLPAEAMQRSSLSACLRDLRRSRDKEKHHNKKSERETYLQSNSLDWSSLIPFTPRKANHCSGWLPLPSGPNLAEKGWNAGIRRKAIRKLMSSRRSTP